MRTTLFLCAVRLGIMQIALVIGPTLLKSLQINYSGSDQTADAPTLVLVCAVGRCSQTKNFKVNESPFKGSNSAVFNFCFLSEVSFQGKNLSPGDKFFPIKADSFGRASSFRSKIKVANKKSQSLFPPAKWRKNMAVYPFALKRIFNSIAEITVLSDSCY